ncbi:helix-turn-helix transcriptional regulator [Phormidium tenue FACHB-886]|nr:helix-turn-helix transcriptional regulator [Phormidium tenue FACHB-886]
MIRQDVGRLSSCKLQQVIVYIDEHLEEHLSVGAISQQVGISQFYFCHLFKQSMGVSPHQYLLQRRIERAKQLLLQNRPNIADIALAVGFANQSHFTRQFKQVVGVTPKRFVHQEQNRILFSCASSAFEA